MEFILNKDFLKKSPLLGKRKFKEIKETKYDSDSGRISPDNKCAICLGRIEQKAFANKCLHAFCKICLLEWSKVKKDCPVCRQPFDKLIHDVKSEYDYKEIDIGAITCQSSYSQNFPIFNQMFTIGLSSNRRVTPLPTNFDLYSSRYSLNDDNNFQVGTIEHRRYIYFSDLYVLPCGNGITNRKRLVSAEFYRKNPLCVNRLIPFLNLELNSLILNQGEKEIVFNLILRSLPKINIISSKFQQLISKFTLHRTVHFIHEFYNFARSIYDVDQYYQIAEYVPRNQTEVVQLIYEDDENLNFNHKNRSSTLSSINRSVYNLSNSDESDIELISFDKNDKKKKINDSKKNNKSNSQNDFDDPKPGPSGLQNNVNFSLNQIRQHYTDDESDSDYDYNLKNHNLRLPFLDLEDKNSVKSDSDDDSIEIIGYVKPRHLRTPEVIELTEDEDEEISLNENSDQAINNNNKKDDLNKKSNYSCKNDEEKDKFKRKSFNDQSKHSNTTHKRIASVIVDPNKNLNKIKSYNNLESFSNLKSLNKKDNLSSKETLNNKHKKPYFSLKNFDEQQNSEINEEKMKIIKQINNAVKINFSRLPSVIGSKSSSIQKMCQKKNFENVETDDESN